VSGYLARHLFLPELSLVVVRLIFSRGARESRSTNVERNQRPYPVIGRLFLTWSMRGQAAYILSFQVDNGASVSICTFIPQYVLFYFHLTRKPRPKLPSSIPFYGETWRGAVRSPFVELSHQRSDLSFAPPRQTQLVVSGQTRPRYAVVGHVTKVSGTNR